MFYIHVFIWKNERFAHSLFFNERWELTKNERHLFFCEQLAFSLIFSQKTSDSLRKLMSEFPALPGSQSPALSTHSKIKIGAAGSIFPLESKFAVTEKEN